MTVSEFAKYVVDNMYRASLANSLNITKSFVNFPYPMCLTEGSNTKKYEFSEFLAEVDKCVGEYLTSGKMNRVRACKIVSIVDKYRRLVSSSYKGDVVYGNKSSLFSDEEMTQEIKAKNGNRYYLSSDKKSYDCIDGKLVPVKLFNYQQFMLVDSFILELWECYQNGN